MWSKERYLHVYIKSIDRVWTFFSQIQAEENLCMLLCTQSHTSSFPSTDERLASSLKTQSDVSSQNIFFNTTGRGQSQTRPIFSLWQPAPHKHTDCSWHNFSHKLISMTLRPWLYTLFFFWSRMEKSIFIHFHSWHSSGSGEKSFL